MIVNNSLLKVLGRAKFVTGTILLFGFFVFTACDKDDDDVSDSKELPDDGVTVEDGDSRAVDLGLSVKWASCNIGASSPEEFGGLYAFGETEVKSEYTRDNYLFYDEENGYYSLKVIGTEYDVAYVKWGGNWRMPNYNEAMELTDECIWEDSEYNGVPGAKVTGPNGKSIFFPYTKFTQYSSGKIERYFSCWTGAASSDRDKSYAVAFSYNSTYSDRGWPAGRGDMAKYSGFSVRAVYDVAK